MFIKTVRNPPPKILSHYVENGTCGNNDHVDGAYGELFSIRDPKCTPITVEVILNDVPVTMEVDTEHLLPLSITQPFSEFGRVVEWTCNPLEYV